MKFAYILVVAATLSACTTNSALKSLKVEVFQNHFSLNGEIFKPPFPLQKLTELIGTADRITGNGYNYYWDSLGVHAFSAPPGVAVEYVDFKLQNEWGFMGQILPSPKNKFLGSILFDGVAIGEIGKLENAGFKGNCRPSVDKSFHVEVLPGDNNARLMLLLGSKPTMGCLP